MSTNEEWDNQTESDLLYDELKDLRTQNERQLNYIRELETNPTLRRFDPQPSTTVKSDGSTASYYELPEGCKELQDLISYKNMNAQMGEIFRETYRYGQASHSDLERGVRKILFYANAELKRLLNTEE